ncbi:two-component regulator propeller domain-containing protein [Parapedobacter deserti]|uniref:histidine kinase n=1 Tax=Parapedobacter deserti TaxID=1912957 RepID=A0ABV7JS71_9SPHI
MLKNLHAFATWLLLCFGLCAGYANGPTTDTLRDLPFHKLDMSHGLSFNSVMCLLEDSRGMLWVGTREGLNRFDGYHFEAFKHRPNDSLSLSNSHINVIFESDAGEIWVGTANGLNRYNSATQGFLSYSAPQDSSGLSNNYVKSMVADTDGHLWIGTSNGLTVLDTEKDSFRHIYLSKSHSNPNNIIALFRDTNGLIWLGTKGGLYVYESGWFRRIVVDPEIEKQGDTFEIRDITQDATGTYWIATEQHGIYAFRYTGGVFRIGNHFHIGNSQMLANPVRKLLADDGRLWLATLSGLSIFNVVDETFTNIRYSIQKPEGLSRGSIHDVIKDRFGGYWIATYSGGLNYYHPQHNLFEHHKRSAGRDEGLSENDVNGFLEDAEGNIWVSTGRGLNHFNRSTGRFSHYGTEDASGLSNRIIKSMVADQQGNLWIGTYNGLNYYDIREKKFRRYFHEPGRNSLHQNQVHALYMDDDGLLWIGMNGGELQVFNPATGIFTEVPGVGNIVSYIQEDSNGHLWIGTRSGLKCIDRATRTPIDLSGLLKGFEAELLFVNWITEDTEKRLWIGTQSSGLFLVKDRQLHWFGHRKGLASNTINAILEDNDGFFWIATNAGLSRVAYREDAAGKPKLVSTDFSEIHGLQGAQFNPGCALKTASGHLLFGGINGFNIFFPKSIKKQSYFPEVVFTHFEIHVKERGVAWPVLGDMTRHPGAPITLKYQQRDISIGFSGVNFVNPDATLYRYSLSGLEHGWVDLGKQRSINFTYLPIGTHEVKIQASTDHMAWGEHFAVLKIVVLPPWWLTKTAYGAYVILFLALSYTIFLFFQRRTKLKNQLYVEKLMREKEQRMLASKLEFFTDISHELRTPLTLILTPLERLMHQRGLAEGLSDQLSMIRRNGQKMMEMINQVLNLRRLETEAHVQLEPADEDLAAFLQEVILTFKPLAIARKIRFDHSLNPEHLIMAFDSSKLEMVMYNLLSNAFKFTAEGGHVAVAMQLSGERHPSAEGHAASRSVRIEVSNSGAPIPPTVLGKLFERYYSAEEGTGSGHPAGMGIGLELSKRMVALHNGHMEVECAAGINRFTVVLPSHKLGVAGATADRKLPRQREAVPDVASAMAGSPNNERQQLLIVEDNDEVRGLIKSLLVDRYHIEEASDGQKGWELALRTIPDLIISDIMMPVVDGIELCRRLKTDIRTSHIPVVLLTARATFAHKYEGYETGADAYITKPFSSSYLLLRIKNLIQQRETMKAQLQRASLLDPGTAIVNSLDNQILRKAKEFIEQHMADSTFTIEQMSREVGLSRMHFHRKVKALTGLSPAEFVRTMRINKAAAILKDNNVSIKETMALVGFENADHFRKCFKEQFGVLPSDYQRTNQPTNPVNAPN